MEIYEPIAPLNTGVGEDTVNDFGEKYKLEINHIYEILNKTTGDGKGGGCKCPPIFDSLPALYENGTAGLVDGGMLRLLGYHKKGDGGGACYKVRWLWSQSDYPWAIEIGATEEVEYELVYQTNGRPQTDPLTGDFVLRKDAHGKPIPLYESDGHTLKKKRLYALIDESVVNYRMFGAKLDGLTDDENALRLCHKYQKETYTIEPLTGRRHYGVRVENHEGIIRKDNSDPIVCCGNIDISGSELLIRDVNATWYGFYLWGDNEEDYLTFEPFKETTDSFKKDNFAVKTAGNRSELKPNALLFLKENPYAVRDDGGYLYSEPRYELSLHTMDGLLTSPITYDWTYPGGLEINSTVSDYGTHEVTTQTVTSHFSCSYTMLPATHYYFIGCDVLLETTANKYCTVLWCKCHNAHIRGFNFRPNPAELHNTRFKNTMIYIWGAYNVEVSDIVGFNAAGKKEGGKNGTSGYVIRATNCLQLHLHDISVQGYWGATAMNCVKDVHIERVNINRLDIHNYFYNLWIDECNLFNHAIQIGEGRGICSITNTNFYINKLEGDSYPNAHILEFNLTYGRIFEGRVLIANCNAYLKDPESKQFDVCKIDFSPEAVSTLDSYRFPDVTIRDCHFYSYNPDTYLTYFMVAGKRNCKTSTKGPSVLVDFCRDLGNDAAGTLMWKYVGRGIDWFSGEPPEEGALNVVPGQYVRTYKKFVDAEGKTAFYDFRYFLVTQAGVLPTPTAGNAPTDESGTEFTLGTARLRHVERHRWEAARSYAVGDSCFTELSSWLPPYCYVCVTAGTSNGWRPTHTAGTAIEGEDVYPKNLDACYWQYTAQAASFITKTFAPRMKVTAGDVLYADHRLYRVEQSGTLNDVPPVHTPWLQTFTEGTAKLVFLGKDWQSVSWWAKGAYCLSYDTTGVLQVYQLVNQDGTTSGEIPIPGNGRCVDGDMIWQHTQEAATKEWKPQTQFFAGDVVSYAGNNYRCVFDGRLELPNQINIENVMTNIKGTGDVFAFWESGTDIPTKLGPSGAWKIKVDNVDCYRFRTFASGYFGHAGNLAPTIIERGAAGQNAVNVDGVSF